jgi:hypothetical protein
MVMVLVMVNQKKVICVNNIKKYYWAGLDLAYTGRPTLKGGKVDQTLKKMLKPDYVNILNQARLKKGMYVKDVTLKAGHSKQTGYNLFSGKPTCILTLTAFCKVLDIDINVLFIKPKVTATEYEKTRHH